MSDQEKEIRESEDDAEGQGGRYFGLGQAEEDTEGQAYIKRRPEEDDTEGHAKKK